MFKGCLGKHNYNYPTFLSQYIHVVMFICNGHLTLTYTTFG